MKLRRLVFVVLLALLAACGRDKTPVSNNPIVEATTRPGQVTIQATGASAVKFTGTATLQIIVTANADPRLRFLSVSVPAPVRAGGLQVQAGFNLVGSSGDGTFQIEARGTSSSPGAVASAAFLQIVAPQRLRYDKPSTPCTVEIRERAHAGSLTCPALADDTGKNVSFTMTWAASA